MPDDNANCCRVVCKAYTGIRGQLTLERKQAGFTVSPEAKAILDLLDEMVEDICK